MLANVPVESSGRPLNRSPRLIDAAVQSQVFAPGELAHLPFHLPPHSLVCRLALLELAFQPDGLRASHSLSLRGLIIHRARIIAPGRSNQNLFLRFQRAIKSAIVIATKMNRTTPGRMAGVPAGLSVALPG